MSYDRQIDFRPRKRTAAIFLPPEIVQEAAWDILLALLSDARSELSMEKLGIVSVAQGPLHQWLAALEERRLIAPRAIRIRAGIDRYLSATTNLQVGTRH